MRSPVISWPSNRLVPELTGTAYDGATIRNVLQMTSAVVFDEDYLDQRSDIQRMGRVLALGGLMDDFTAMPLQIFDWAGRPQEEFHRVAAAGIIVLLSALLLFNALAVFIRQKFQKPLQ